MIRVSSLDDPRIADYQLLADPAALVRANLFVAEGRLVVRRLLANARLRTQSVLVTEAALEALGDLVTKTPAPVFVVGQDVMNAVAGFNIHRGCLALASRPQPVGLEQLDIRHAKRLVILEGVNNPDNVGGIFRSAAAFATDVVIVGPACSDPLYRKSIRTSMAATLAVPFSTGNPWPDVINEVRRAGFRVLALTPADDAIDINTKDRTLDRVAILVGAEGEGLSDGALHAADERVRIPMGGPAESLNVTVAASIALHWFRR